MEGCAWTAEALRSRFARVRVRPCGEACAKDQGEEWLLIEWPKGEAAPIKFWLSTLPKNIGFKAQVDITMMRWRIERDYHDLKQEVGLGHFEGRGWVGFHHHATLCIAAYGFLISERGAFSPPLPNAWPPGTSRRLSYPKVSDPEAPPPRPERHVPDSIATMRRRIEVELTRRLPRCPCCARPIARRKWRGKT
jgi:hypothetical protein